MLDEQLHTAELDLCHDYADWLREHGVDPDTGRMSDAGVGFGFKLPEDRATA